MKLQDKRAHQLSDKTDKTPELKLEQIRGFIKDDLHKCQSTLWMIINNPEMIDSLAQMFYNKIQEIPEGAKEAAKHELELQKNMIKAD